MTKKKCIRMLWIFVTVFALNAVFTGNLFACNGGGGGGGGGNPADSDSYTGDPVSTGTGSTTGSSTGGASSGSSSSSGWEEENIDPQFRTPDFVKNDPPAKERDPWGLKTKPDQWPEEKWKGYVKKRQSEFTQQLKEANEGKEKAELNDKIAQGTGLVATGAGAVVSVVAAPAVLPIVVGISVAGDGLAATAGSLAQGKSVGESLGDGVKKSVSSAVLSKVSAGKKGLDAAIGFGGSVGYDNINTQKKALPNQMPPPDFKTSFGHEIQK